MKYINANPRSATTSRPGRLTRVLWMAVAVVMLQPVSTCLGDEPTYLSEVLFQPVEPWETQAHTADYVWDFDARRLPPVELASIVEAVLDDPPLPDPGEPEGTGSGEIEGAEALGTAPDTSYRLQFLRRQTPLLDPGELQIDYGISYTLTENDPPIPQIVGGNVVNVQETRIRQRLLLTPVAFRYGLVPGLQLFLNVPMGWSNTEVSFGGFDEFSSTVGVGDISAGASFVMREGYCGKPYIIGTLAMTAPTGTAAFPLLTTLAPDSQLGEGYWAAAASVLFINTYDPISIFYGLGYRHRFDGDFLTSVGRLEVNPGEQIFYQLGIGFAVSSRVTLSARFNGAYITENYINGDRVEGSILEPMQMRFACTIQNCRTIVEPFATIGMTDDGPSARAGITWTY